MKRGFNKTQKKYIIGSLIVVVLIMSVAFAAFSTSLNIQGTSKVDSKWDVEIVSITPNETANKVENTYTTSGDITHSITNNLTANFSAVLISPGDSVVYKIVVENKGTLDAQLDSITKNLGSNSDITFAISGINESSLPEKLAANSTKEFTVTVTFVDNPAGQGNPTNKTSSFSLTMNYSQYDGSSSGSGSSEPLYTGTVYRNNTKTVVLNGPVAGNVYCDTNPDNGNKYGCYATENDCQTSIKDYADTATCEPMTATISDILGNYSEDASDLGKNYYLKHEIENNIVKASYLCFILDEKEICGDAQTMKNLFWIFRNDGRIKCKVAGPTYNCSAEGLEWLYADQNGVAVAGVSNSISCGVYNDSSSCAE